jgi:signal transduction histidine kinase/CheY-like chemotaxis protein
MLMAAGVIGVILFAEGLAWVGLARLERSLGEVQAGMLADVRRVMTLAESASGLSAFAHRITEIRDRETLVVAERALEGRLEEFAALASALPVPTDRPALPVGEPTIVRMADRLDGILRHLFLVTAEAIEAREASAAASTHELAFVDPRQRYLLAAISVAATDMSGLVKGYASLVERSDRARAEVMAEDLLLGKIAAGLLGALALIASLGFANAFLRGVVADLLGIAEAMRRLSDGDLEATAPGGKRLDEIGVLARAFAVFRTQARERAEIEGRLRRAERLEAIGRLTGGIAHDFNNLLTAVSTNLQLIHDAAEPGSATRVRALRALAAAENGAAMVSHLLSFGRRQMLAPIATDVEASIATVIDLVEAGIVGGIGLTARRKAPGDAPPPALVDPAGLETALINLLFNARDAVAPRGRIVVETSRTADGLVRIEVIDDGAGMDPETLARVFEPFFTTKPSGAGSGLGLSMVWGFVRQSGGRIDVASRPGLGTTVTVDLPAAVGELPAEPSAKPIPRTGAAGRRLRILLVEDEPEVRATIADLLATLGHTAVAVASSGEARSAFAADGAFDLVLTDLRLKGDVDGVDLAEMLRAIRPESRILVMTGHLGDTTIDLPVLAKPFDGPTLEEAMRRAVD